MQRPTAQEREAARKRSLQLEQLTVLRQPHRRGEIHQFAESPLGRLVLRLKLHDSIYDAGLEYGTLVRRYYAAAGIPQVIRGAAPGPTTGGVDPKIAVETRRRLFQIERPLRRMPGFAAMRVLTVNEMEIDPGLDEAAAKVLFELAVELKNLPRDPRAR